ncbi:hypothetical protein ACW9HH_14865 [Nocardia gipuzkoensis]
MHSTAAVGAAVASTPAASSVLKLQNACPARPSVVNVGVYFAAVAAYH